MLPVGLELLRGLRLGFEGGGLMGGTTLRGHWPPLGDEEGLLLL